MIELVQKVRECKWLDAEVAASEARLTASADKYLANLDENSKSRPVFPFSNQTSGKIIDALADQATAGSCRRTKQV